MADEPAELQPASPKPPATEEEEGEGQRREDGDPFDTFSPSFRHSFAADDDADGDAAAPRFRARTEAEPEAEAEVEMVAQVLADLAANRRRSLGDLQYAHQLATARAGWSAHGRRSFRGQLKPAEADSVKRSIGTGLLD